MRRDRRRIGGGGPYPTGSLTRNLITLAVLTGIPMSEWVEYGESGIATAWQVIRSLRGGDGGNDDGRVMSG